MTKLWWQAVQRVRGWLYRHDWQLALALGLAIVGGVLWLMWPRHEAAAARPPLRAQELEAAQERWVIVHVSGAVAHPGLYRLPATQRVSDAIVAAGGVTEAADPARMPNLAAHLHDGKQVLVPFRNRGKRPQGKLDINSASREQLLGIPDIDPDLADAILDYRETHGLFQRLAELKSGVGVDQALYLKLQKVLIVS